MLLSLYMQSSVPTNPHRASMVGYGPLSLYKSYRLPLHRLLLGAESNNSEALLSNTTAGAVIYKYYRLPLRGSSL
jgi:hypothetical protein